MLSSRALSVLYAAKLLNRPTAIKQAVRNSHALNYRSGVSSHPKIIIYAAEGVQGFAWWWILWHLWTEPGHVFGEFPFPDATKWTDEELGIPPDGTVEYEVGIYKPHGEALWKRGKSRSFNGRMRAVVDFDKKAVRELLEHSKTWHCCFDLPLCWVPNLSILQDLLRRQLFLK